MSEYAETHRKAMKEKAERLTRADPHQKVDASDWTPPEALETTAKTGERPVSRRQFKKGGKVQGERAVHHAGRKPRKSGGRSIADAIVNSDVREANRERDGVKHVGGFKRGGRAHKADGGSSVPTSRFAFTSGPSMMTKAAGLKTGGKAERRGRGMGGPLPPLGLAEIGINSLIGDKDKDQKRRGGSVSNGEQEGTRPTGGREARKHGGKAGKGKVNVNIIIAQKDPGQDSPHMPVAPPPAPPVRPSGMPLPMAPQGGPGGPPPMPPGGGPPPMPPGMQLGGPPVMPRRKGGRVEQPAGAGSGLGRLEKVKAYGDDAHG